jgi:hypothetical protein
MSKKRCHNCGTTKFGLIRRYRFMLHFCSGRCEEAHLRQQETKVIEARKRWLAHLACNARRVGA